MKLRFAGISMFIFLSMLAVSCGGSSYMKLSTAKVTSSPEMATIVFYRSTKYGGKIKSAILDVTTPETKFYGSLASKSKIVVQVPAGDYTFMILGENADFAYASVEAGHIYYIIAQVRMGVWKARFSLNPVSKEELNSPSFAHLDVCKLYEKTPEADVWFAEHKTDIEQKREAYYKKWMSKPESDRPRLNATDYKE